MNYVWCLEVSGEEKEIGVKCGNSSPVFKIGKLWDKEVKF